MTANTMASIYSFPPVATDAASTLILGSMPGAMSLQKQQYYAHPRNAFWTILGHLLGFDPNAAYAQRIAALGTARIALWDVLQSCRRAGSLDADIDRHSMIPNDFTTFFATHPHIRRVFFNGAAAEAIYRKRVLPTLVPQATLTYTRLPSTSPAHAALSGTAKLLHWQVLIEPRS